MVALGLALLAHRFRVVGTLEPHRKTVGQKPRAFGTDPYLFLFDLSHVKGPKGERRLLAVMMFPAIDPYEFHQDSHVGLFL